MPQALIEARDICLTVPQPGNAPLTIVDAACLIIEAGQTYAVTGRSGSGKTSLLSVLGLLNTDYSGELRIQGRDAAKLADHESSMLRAQSIGFVFQGYSLVPHLSALENVMLPCIHAKVNRSETLRRAKAALAEVGLQDRLSAKPVALSGGEQQRVAIARSIVNRPQVVMADEPTGALDTDTGTAVMQMLMNRVKDAGIALVVVTHDMEVARCCERHFLMDHGRLSEKSLPPTSPPARRQLRDEDTL